MQQDTGQPHPAVLTRPSLRNDCLKYYEAFRLLGTARQWNQVGPQPIALSEILTFVASGLGIDDYETRQKYVRLIQRMDSVELEFRSRKST